MALSHGMPRGLTRAGLGLTLLAAAAGLPRAADPVPTPSAPATVTEVGGKTFKQWLQDLSNEDPSVREEAGSLLSFKLRYVLDRTRTVYPQEVPDEPDGPRYIFTSGDMGRIVLARKTDGPGKGKWLFTAETVDAIPKMMSPIA